MKYTLIKKILNSPISILDYLILEHIANNTAKEFVEDKDQTPFKGAIFGHVTWLKQEDYISDNNKLTLKGKELLDQLQKEEINTDFYSSLHKNLQEKMISLTGKKQIQGFGGIYFIPTIKELEEFLLRFWKIYPEFKDNTKITKCLINHVENCIKSNKFAPAIKYYIFKVGSGSQLASAYDYIDDLENTNDFDGLNI